MSEPLHAGEVASLLLDIADQFGYDFRGYRPESMMRRVQAALLRTSARTVADLQMRLHAQPALLPVVLDCLTVQVSELFRDPASYLLFRREVVPVLRTYAALAVWIAGCSGGEEVYSMAILLAEEGLLDRTQLYATDLSEVALERARQGTFSAQKLSQSKDAYGRAGGTGVLDGYFTVAGNEAQLAERLRQRVAFFQHDLGTDQVFGEMQVVFCRNVLIYFGPELRRRALGKLQRSLCPGGFLALGASERLLVSERAGMTEVSASVPLYRRSEEIPNHAVRSLPTPVERDREQAMERQRERTKLRWSTVPAPTPVRPHVLLVDDNEDNLVALEALLGDMECELHRASSGNEALRLLLKHEFALVLLDVQMPNMDGYEVARYARDNPQTRDVPIIFLTAAHQSETGLLRGYGSGAVDYLHKPLNPRVLRGKVAVFLELDRSRQRLAATMADLDEARVAAERANRFKSQFLANMSHELRTPLNAIIGFGELLEDDPTLGGEHKEFVGHIISSGKHLVTLMNDILDLSRIEAGRVDLTRQRTAMVPLIQAARDIVRPTAIKLGVALEARVAEDLPDASVDPVRLKQVLYNLLSNGLKFTPRGGRVTLRAAAGDGRIVIAVEDTGIGMRPEDLDRLFKEFERIQSTSGPKPEGTGLGLALSKRLVELHGGTIAVTSQIGKGSVFTVSLPVT
jgi:two-component system, sensor histidine kinase